MGATVAIASCANEVEQPYVLSYHPKPSDLFANNATGPRNPKHGQPGHRCDIPDGALLPAGSVATTAATTANTIHTTSVPAALNANVTGQPVAALTNTAALNPAHGQPGHRCDLAVGAPLNSAPSAASVKPGTAAAPASSSNLNPAHGQPGHRCDLAVGAPLNSAPAAKASPAATSTTPLTPKPKLNPAHGQPWHRCDIAVGASLDTPVASKKPADSASLRTVQQAVDSNKTSIVVPSTDSTGGGNSAGVRLNPPHGQPGHDCKIAVGKPLKQ